MSDRQLISEAGIARVAPRTAIETVHNFSDSRKTLVIRSLRIGYFFELADNGPLDCSEVVGIQKESSY